MAEFLHCYKVMERESGWWYFSTKTAKLNLVKGLPSSHKRWKDRFFYIYGNGWEF